MNADEIKAAWGRRVVADKTWLLHTPTLAIGQAQAFFETGAYVSEVNGESVPDAVLRLTTGHAFVVNPNAFVEMTVREVDFFVMATDRFTKFMTGAVEHAAVEGIPASAAVTILVSLLRAQQRALEAMSTKEESP